MYALRIYVFFSVFLQLHFFDQLLGGLTVRCGREAAILGWVWSCAHCVGNVRYLRVVTLAQLILLEWQAALLEFLVSLLSITGRKCQRFLEYLAPDSVFN